MRAGVDATTGDARKGLGADQVGYHAVAIWGWTEKTYAMLGYQSRLNHAAPRQVILAGATLRW